MHVPPNLSLLLTAFAATGVRASAFAPHPGIFKVTAPRDRPRRSPNTPNTLPSFAAHATLATSFPRTLLAVTVTASDESINGNGGDDIFKWISLSRKSSAPLTVRKRILEDGSGDPVRGGSEVEIDYIVTLAGPGARMAD